MTYMLMAFVWWAILLYNKNEEIYQAKTDIINLKKGLKASNFDEINLTIIKEEKRRQKSMILGEGAVFTITLLIGIWLINRANRRELETANQQKNFLLSITHELKSPIASIRLAFDTFLKRDLNSDQITSLSKGALYETERLNELVNDLLLSAKLENSYDLNIEIVNLAELINVVTDKFSESHPTVNISTDIDATLSKIECDRQGVILVISNLLENGVKYNFKEPKKLNIKLLDNKNSIILEISDNGNGIDDKDKKKIYNKFFRSGNEETRKTKGTGLGLYIVKEIIESHKGSIEVKTNLPEGTIFKIKLPKTQRLK